MSTAKPNPLPPEPLQPRPLSGRRVLVTRPSHQAESLAAPLRSLGADVLLLPALQIAPPADPAPLEAAVADLDRYHWLVVTSANGATALARELTLQGRELMPTLQIAAVGPATAAALPEALHPHISPMPQTVVPQNFRAEQLAHHLSSHVEGKRLLLVQGSSATPELQQALSAAGADVHRVDAYRILVPADLNANVAQWLRDQRATDAVTFTSAQMARNFFAAIQASGHALPPHTLLASIGPVTTQALRHLGHPPQVEAPTATMQSLANALATHNPT